MRIEDLEYHAPKTLAQANELLSSLGRDARVIAGGTDVLADLKQGLITTGSLVSLASIQELKAIKFDDHGLWIGAMVTPNQLAASEEIQAGLQALAEAGASMAGTQIRNLATLGGNCCSAVPSADLPPSLVAAGAEFILTSYGGERRVPADQFFVGPRKTQLKPGEIMSAVYLPRFPADTGTTYIKFQLRGASALAVVGVAARLTIEPAQPDKIATARIAIGAAAPKPILVEQASRFLEGKAPTDAHFEEAGALAADEVKPITDLRGSEQYRRSLSRVLTVRVLKRALERLNQKESVRHG
jgi:carbon-monoxide dehydrogenase medium subunit